MTESSAIRPAMKPRKRAAKPRPPLEHDIQTAIIAALRADPRVGWVERVNTGAFKVGARYVKFGWRGCSDIVGQMADSRFIAIEVKRPTTKPTEEQEQFLSRVHLFGGVAGVARSVDDALQIVGGQ